MATFKKGDVISIQWTPNTRHRFVISRVNGCFKPEVRNWDAHKSRVHNKPNDQTKPNQPWSSSVV